MSFDVETAKLKVEELKKKIATEAAEQIAADTRSNILSLGNKLGLRALKPATIRKKGHGHILVDTGLLARSIRVGETPGNKVGVGVPSNQIEVAKYANVHERGLGGLPQRSFLRATANSSETKNLIKIRLEKVLRESFAEIFQLREQ